MCLSTWWEGMNKSEPGYSQLCALIRWGQWTQAKTHEIPLEHEKTLFYSECDQTLEQVAQRGGVVSFCSGIKKLTRHNHGQQAQGDLPEQGGRLDYMIS